MYCSNVLRCRTLVLFLFFIFFYLFIFFFLVYFKYMLYIFIRLFSEEKIYVFGIPYYKLLTVIFSSPSSVGLVMETYMLFYM